MSRETAVMHSGVKSVGSIGIIGAGQMGSGIAEVCAKAGLMVQLHDVSERAALAGTARIEQSLLRAIDRNKISGADAEATLSRIKSSNDLDALGELDLVIEAATEDEDVKLAIFAELDKVIRHDDTLLASNTSSIPIMKIAMATTRPDRVIGMHFFNPVPVLRLIEIVPSMLTSDVTEQRVTTFAVDVLGKTPVRSQDRAGFVVNALLVPYILAAVRMLESGFASVSDIDNGMILGCAHPMGPLALADLIGLDTVRAIADAMYAEFKEPLYSPAPILLRMVEAGLFGKKSGRGFYDYR